MDVKVSKYKYLDRLIEKTTSMLDEIAPKTVLKNEGDQ